MGDTTKSVLQNHHKLDVIYKLFFK